MSSIEARHARNPHTKDHLFLQLDSGNELWSYVFYEIEVTDDSMNIIDKSTKNQKS